MVPDNNEERMLKHLDYIQDIISRMANNSFSYKGWNIALITGLLGISIVQQNQQISVYLIGLALVPNLLFWALDAYYLHLEKKFKHLYEAVRKNLVTQNYENGVECLCMDVSKVKHLVPCYLSVVFSLSVWPFYLINAFTIGVVILLKSRGII
ncbi:MAG TPA: hypothetical protein PKC68_00265 [Alphaproteobacteria bacterium]|nr:hypothetical protein [Alphaproteobacteria bacterium]